MHPQTRIRLLIVSAVAVIAASVWFASETQLSAADRDFRALAANQAMLTALLDQEEALRGYLDTHDRSFLSAYEGARRRFESALLDARARTESGLRRQLAIETSAAREWQARSERAIGLASGARVTRAAVTPRGQENLLRRFRASNAAYAREAPSPARRHSSAGRSSGRS